jgi:hypothetical protein
VAAITVGGYESQLGLHAAAEFLVGQTRGSALANGCKNCPAQERNREEIVEVTRLQCRILPVVGETEELATVRRQ